MIYGCIGRKLTHSFSKDIHNLLADYTYNLIELEPEELSDFMLKKEFNAINVTIPYKSEVISFLDEISPIAKKIGAVNTVVNNNGKLYGYNTDFLGLKALIEKNGICLKDKKVAVLGTGGTSKTACCVAEYLGASEIITVSRGKENGTTDYENFLSSHKDTQIIINTTPVGMYPDNNSQPISIEGFDNLSGVIDVVYNPLMTRLVLSAKQKNIPSCGGLYMLVSQAAFAVEKFLDTNIEKEKIDSIYNIIKNKKRNIVLIGMPSCGKSTVGKILSNELNIPFFDTDNVVEENYGLPPAEIINNFGEEKFRQIEAQAVYLCSKNSGCVIATGGGAVLKNENSLNLKQNGIIFYLNRSLENLLIDDSRPLTATIEKLNERFIQRKPLYEAAADYIIDANADISTITAKIKGIMSL